MNTSVRHPQFSIRCFVLIFTCLLSIIFSQGAAAQSWKGKELVQASLVADSSAVVPGKPLRVGLLLRMFPGWHTYWKNPGDVGTPTAIDWKLPPGFRASDFQWPIPQRMALAGNIVDYGYGGEVLLITEIRTPSHLDAKEIVLQGRVSWLACAEICVPGRADLSLALPVAASALPKNTQLFEQFERLLPAAVPTFPVSISRFAGGVEICAQPGIDTKNLSFYPLPTANQQIGKITESHSPDKKEWTIRVPVVGDLKGILVTESTNGVRRGYELKPTGEIPASLPTLFRTIRPIGKILASPLTLLQAILYGFLGGLILNLMPCVFPVISLKIFGFIRQAGEKPGRIFRHGLAFAGGVFAWFFVLAAIVVLLQSRGHAANWAFQFQSPAFNFVIIAVVFVFALNMFGMFEIFLPSATTTGLSRLAEREGLLGSFFQGAFATLLATPCTAPFLGAALGFAFSQSGGIIFLVFASVAAGLSAPYLILSARTGWIRFVPRPGKWMERVKQFMGFPLLATVVWLLAVLGSQRGLSAVVATLAFLLCLGFCCWAIAAFSQPGVSVLRYWLFILASLAITSSAVFFVWPYAVGMSKSEHLGIPWKTYSKATLDEALAAGNPVFVNFTADWCITCKFNEKTAIERPAVAAAFRSQRVVPLKADWTNHDPAIGAALRSFGRVGVPFYVFYPKKSEPYGNSETYVILPELLTETLLLKALKNPPSAGK